MNIYHMTHLKNLSSIFQKKALFSRTKIEESDIDVVSIADYHIQRLRKRILIRCDLPNHDAILFLHDYVPFYFATRTAMLRRQMESGIQDEIIYLEMNRTILKEEGTLFTDGNATNQQLSLSEGECVIIEPAMLPSDKCNRIYPPNGPMGQTKIVRISMPELLSMTV